MSAITNDKEIAFDLFSLDLVNECLRKGSEEIKIRPKAFALLTYLLNHSGQLVTKEELLNAVWPETYVGEAVLKVTVRQLREALDDDPKSPRYIETSHRRGYRFIGQISRAKTTADEYQPDNYTSGAFSVYTGVLGREQTLGRMQRWLRRAFGAQRQIVFITGEAGIGKTALVDAFARMIPADGTVRVGRGQCLEQYGTGEAYLPVLEAIGRLCREDAKVVEVMRAHAPMWLLQMPSLLGPAERESLSKEVSGVSRERMLREMGEALDALTAEVPLVLILEDLHWSDYSTLDLISYIATRRQPAHLMLIGTYRNVELMVSGHPLNTVKQDLLAKQLCKEVPLEYLSTAAVSDYLAVTFPGNRFPAGLAKLVHQRTDGNPLFMVNAVNYLVEAGLIVMRDERWTLADDIANVKVGVPDNIKQMIHRHVDHLGLDTQRTLETASVAGVEFSTPALAAGLGEDPRIVETRANELARQRQYIQESGVQELPNGDVVTRFGFVHALYQNILYERIPESRRVQLHRLIGERGEEVFGERSVDISTELAMHFERGRDYKRAVHYLKEGANNAVRRFAYQEAVDLARHGIELLAKLPSSNEVLREALCLHLTVGVPLIALEGYASPNVGKVYQKARELCEQVGDTPDIAEVLWGQWAFHTLRAEFSTAREIAEEFLHLAERLPYPGLALRGHWAMEITFTHIGDFVPALDHYKKASELYDPAQHHDDSFLYTLNPGVAMPCFAAWSLWFRGFPDQSLTAIESALSLGQELAEPNGLAHAFLFSCQLHHFRRDELLTQYYADAAFDIAETHGLGLYRPMAKIMKGLILSRREPGSEAIEQMREGIAALDETETLLVRPHFLGLLAEALARVDQTEVALQLVDEALELVQSKGERYYEAELYRLKGEMLKTDPAAAEQFFVRSMATAEAQQAKSWQLRAATSLARLYLSQNRAQQAADLLGPIYDSFTEGFDTEDLKDARALLDATSFYEGNQE